LIDATSTILETRPLILIDHAIAIGVESLEQLLPQRFPRCLTLIIVNRAVSIRVESLQNLLMNRFAHGSPLNIIDDAVLVRIELVENLLMQRFTSRSALVFIEATVLVRIEFIRALHQQHCDQWAMHQSSTKIPRGIPGTLGLIDLSIAIRIQSRDDPLPNCVTRGAAF
jgi:hypothetical protein